MTPTDANVTSGIVLVIDDDPIIRKVHAELVKKLGFKPLCLDDANELVFSLNYFTNISAILMDMNMPLLDGYKATKKIRAIYKDLNHPSHLPIIAISGVEKNKKKCLKAGCDFHLEKPVSLKDLTEVFELAGCMT